MSNAFGRGCDTVPNAAELRNYLIVRKPSVFGVYSPSQRTTEIYTRLADAPGGYSLSIYESTNPITTISESRVRSKSTTKQLTTTLDIQILNFEEIIARYQSLVDVEKAYSAGIGPLPDIVTQYAIYRARICMGIGTRYKTYPGNLVMHFHTLMLNNLPTDKDKQVYLSAFLAIPPNELFISTAHSNTEKVLKLVNDVNDSLRFILTKDLDPRGEW